MAHDLTAALTLKLIDQLSGPIEALKRKLDALKALADKLAMPGLDRAEEMLRRADTATTNLVAKLDAVPAAARRGAEALRQMADQAIRVSSAGMAALPGQAAMQARALAVRAAMASAPLMLTYAGSGGRPPILPPVPVLAAASASAGLLPFGGGSGGDGGLGGAGWGGGMPLVMPNMAALHWANLRQQAGGFRLQLAGSVAQMQALGHATTSLAEGGMRAFVTGFGLIEPIKMYAEQENLLRHMAITAGKTGPDVERMIGELEGKYNAMALAMGQRGNKVTEAASFLSTTGIGQDIVDKLVPTIARAATAYNTPMQDATQMAFTLHELLKIHPEKMEEVLSMGALAGKASHFSFADMSRFLPEIASSAASRGIKGEEGAASLFAMLATSRRHAGTSGQAATNVQDFLAQLDMKQVGKGFAHHKINLPALLLDAEKKGINPAEAVIMAIKRITAGKTPQGTAAIVNDIFHNQQARTAVQSLLQDTGFYLKLKEELLHAGPNQILTDWQQAMRAPLVKLGRVQELLEQSVKRFGKGFVAELGPLDWLLTNILAGLQAMDSKWPGVLDKVLGGVGGFLALTAVLGLLVPVFRLVRMGALLLLTPFTLAFSALRVLVAGFGFLTASVAAIGLPFGVAAGVVLAAAAAIAGAAYLIYSNWGSVGPWLSRMWDGISTSVGGFLGVIKGLYNGDLGQIISGFSAMFAGWKIQTSALGDALGGLATGFGSLGTAVMAGLGALQSFGDWLTDGAVSRTIAATRREIEGITSALNALKPPAPAAGTPAARDQTGAAARWGVDGVESWPLPGQNSAGINRPEPARVDLTVRAAPGTEIVRSEQSGGSTVRLQSPDRGAMTGRP